MSTVTARITAAGLADLNLNGSYTVAKATPAIPDGKYPMGFQGLVKGQPATLKDCGDWNFATMGYDLSGYRIHGKVVCRANNIVGDGFEIVGADSGTTANALLDFNTHFTGAQPNLKHFTIKPTVPIVSVNAWMGDEATLFDFDISGVGGDGLSPNNLSNGKLPLNMKADWGYVHDLVYYKKDSSHADGTHNDGCQIPGGSNASFTRIYFTGISHPTLGDGKFLRTNGPGTAALPGPRPLGQINSSVMVTQDVSHVGGITFDHCRFGGGWYTTINLDSKGNSAALGPITITNSLFDGNSFYGLDIAASPGTILNQSGNKRIDGSAIKVKLNNT